MAHHLTVEEREVIAQMLNRGRNQAEIARRLDRSESTISREVRRNRSRNGYGAVSLVERKSGHLLLGKVANLHAATVRQSAAELYRTTPPALRIGRFV